MKLSLAALALAIGLVAAAPAPGEEFQADAAVVERAIAELVLGRRVPEGEEPRLQRRACKSNQLCSRGKCYSVVCVGHNTCNINEAGGSC